MYTQIARRFTTAAAAAAPNQPTSAKLIGRYQVVPRDLFRIMLGPNVRLRDLATQQTKGRSSYDLIVHDGLVKPSEGEFFQGPNGASFRPNTFNLQNTVRTFKAPEFTVLKLPEGTKLPPNLVLLHEHTDHFSIQCAEPMKLYDLNGAITRLIKKQGTTYSKEEFLEQFPYNSAAAC